MNLGMVTLYVQDVPKAIAFYTGTLGLSVDEAQSSDVFAMLRTSNDHLIALEDVKILPPGQARPAGSIELNFEVENVDVIYQDWQARGIEMVQEPLDAPFGRSFMAKDPDGHYLTLYRLAG